MEGSTNTNTELNLREQLIEAQARLAAIEAVEAKIAKSVPGLAFIFDANTESMVYIVGNIRLVMGYDLAELQAMGAQLRQTLFAGPDLDRLLRESDEFRATAGDHEIISTDCRLRRKDGKLLWVRLSRSVSVRNEDGSVAEVVGSLADISSEKRAEKELRLTRFSVSQSTEGILWVRPDGSFHSVNKAACKDLGYTRAELMELRVCDLDESVGADEWDQMWKRFQNGATQRFETRVRRKNGDTLPVEISATLLEFEGEEYVFVFLKDITNREAVLAELKDALEENSRLKDQLEAENEILRGEIRLQHLHGDIVGTSELMKSVMLQAEQVARTDSTVLIEGETGTGKELLARAIHDLSKRTDGPLVTVNCAAIPTNLAESELFGYQKGAFTGAHQNKIGRFEAANGGTIFLDEIGELPEDVQAKLLRVLEEGQVEPLGSVKAVSVDVRVLAATNRNLAVEVSHKRFREDLFYRLNVFPIELPPLRDREGDVSALAWRFVEEFSEKMGKPIECISRKSIEVIEHYSWPGNVRELRNVIERAMIRSSGTTLVVESPGDLHRDQRKVQTLEHVQRTHIVETMEHFGWKVRGIDGAAKALGLHPNTLESKMKKLKIARPIRRVLRSERSTEIRLCRVRICGTAL